MSDEAIWKQRFVGYTPIELVDFAAIGATDRAKWALEVLDEKLTAMGCQPRG